MRLWKAYLIGLGIFIIIGSIWQFVQFGQVDLVRLGTFAGEYFLYGSMVFGIYWGVRRFIHNKALAIIIALIPIIILRLAMAMMVLYHPALQPK